jgi:hypothetical protein
LRAEEFARLLVFAGMRHDFVEVRAAAHRFKNVGQGDFPRRAARIVRLTAIATAPFDLASMERKIDGYKDAANLDFRQFRGRRPAKPGGGRETGEVGAKRRV